MDSAAITIIVASGAIAFTATVALVWRIFEMRHERLLREPAQPTDVAARLHRIEAALETTALEVERVSEAQRFIAKSLADRGELPGVPPRGA